MVCNRGKHFAGKARGVDDGQDLLLPVCINARNFQRAGNQCSASDIVVTCRHDRLPKLKIAAQTERRQLRAFIRIQGRVGSGVLDRTGLAGERFRAQGTSTVSTAFGSIAG